MGEPCPQDGVPRRDLAKGRDQRLLVEGPDDGADDLLEVHAGCLAEEAVEQHSLLRRRELVRVDDADLARLRHSVTPRSGQDRLEDVTSTLPAIARRTGQQRPQAVEDDLPSDRQKPIFPHMKFLFSPGTSFKQLAESFTNL